MEDKQLIIQLNEVVKNIFVGLDLNSPEDKNNVPQIKLKEDHDNLIKLVDNFRKYSIDEAKIGKKVNQLNKIFFYLSKFNSKCLKVMYEKGSFNPKLYGTVSEISKTINDIKVYIQEKPEIMKPLRSKNLHFVWIGALGKQQKDYLKIWVNTNKVTNYKINLWHDSGAFLVPSFGKIIREQANLNVNKDSGPREIFDNKQVSLLWKEIISLQNEFYRFYIEYDKNTSKTPKTLDEAIIAFVSEKKPWKKKKDLLALREKNKKTFSDAISEINKDFKLSKDKLSLQDISSLQPKEFDSSISDSDAILIGRDKDYYRYYLKELGLRQNLAAASDFARVSILKQHGGVYTDLDQLPAWSEKIKTSIDTILKKQKSPLTSDFVTTLLGNNTFSDEEIHILFLDKLKELDLRYPIEKLIFAIQAREFIVMESTRHLMEGLKKGGNFPDLTIPQHSKEQYMFLNSKGPNNFVKIMVSAIFVKIMDSAIQNFIAKTPSQNLLQPLGKIFIPKGKLDYLGGLIAAKSMMNNSLIITNKGGNFINTIYDKILDNATEIEMDNHDGLQFPSSKWTKHGYRYDSLLSESASTIDLSGPNVLSDAQSTMFPLMEITLPDDYENYLRHSILPQNYTSLALIGTPEAINSTWVSEGQIDRERFYITQPNKQHIVIQIGDSSPENAAASFLWQKHKGATKWVKFNQATKQFADVKGRILSDDKDTKVTIVSHGVKGELTEPLADASITNDIMTFIASQNVKSIKNISIVACEMASGVTQPQGDIKDGFIYDFLKTLHKKGIKLEDGMTVRNGLVTVDALGHKYVKKPLPSGQWSSWLKNDKDATKIKASITEQDGSFAVKYQEIPLANGILDTRPPLFDTNTGFRNGVYDLIEAKRDWNLLSNGARTPALKNLKLDFTDKTNKHNHFISVADITALIAAPFIDGRIIIADPSLDRIAVFKTLLQDIERFPKLSSFKKFMKVYPDSFALISKGSAIFDEDMFTKLQERIREDKFDFFHANFLQENGLNAISNYLYAMEEIDIIRNPNGLDIITKGVDSINVGFTVFNNPQGSYEDAIWLTPKEANALSHNILNFDGLVNDCLVIATDPIKQDVHKRSPKVFSASLDTLEEVSIYINTPKEFDAFKNSMARFKQSSGSLHRSGFAESYLPQLGESLSLLPTDGSLENLMYNLEHTLKSSLFEDSKAVDSAVENIIERQKKAKRYNPQDGEKALKLLEKGTKIDREMLLDDKFWEDIAKAYDKKNKPFKDLVAERKKVLDSSAYGATIYAEFMELAEKLKVSSAKLMQEHSLGKNYYPVLEDIKINRTVVQGKVERTYNIPFVSTEETSGEQRVKYIDTKDESIYKFKKQLKQIEAGKNPLGLGIKYNAVETSLSLGMTIKGIVDLIKDAHLGPLGGKKVDNQVLANAMVVQYYTGIASTSFGAVGNVKSAVDFAIQLSKKEIKMLSGKLLTKLGTAFGYGMAGINVAFSIMDVVLTSIQLAETENEEQKVMLTTQLVFSVIGLGIGIAILGALILGATTALSVLGPVGLLVGVLAMVAMGILVLINNIKFKFEQAIEVAKAFTQLYEGYKENYEIKEKVFLPKSNITELRIRGGRVEYLKYGVDVYQEVYESPAEGLRPTAWWHSLREAFGFKMEERNVDISSKVDTVILPSSVRKNINLKYDWVFTSATKDYSGETWKIVKLLESKTKNKKFSEGRFVFNEFVWIGLKEVLLTEIHTYYLETPIKVVLGEEIKNIVVGFNKHYDKKKSSAENKEANKLIKEIADKISYELELEGTQHVIVLGDIKVKNTIKLKDKAELIIRVPGRVREIGINKLKKTITIKQQEEPYGLEVDEQIIEIKAKDLSSTNCQINFQEDDNNIYNVHWSSEKTELIPYGGLDYRKIGSKERLFEELAKYENGIVGNYIKIKNYDDITGKVAIYSIYHKKLMVLIMGEDAKVIHTTKDKIYFEVKNREINYSNIQVVKLDPETKEDLRIGPIRGLEPFLSSNIIKPDKNFKWEYEQARGILKIQQRLEDTYFAKLAVILEYEVYDPNIHKGYGVPQDDSSEYFIVKKIRYEYGEKSGDVMSAMNIALEALSKGQFHNSNPPSASESILVLLAYLFGKKGDEKNLKTLKAQLDDRDLEGIARDNSIILIGKSIEVELVPSKDQTKYKRDNIYKGTLVSENWQLYEDFTSKDQRALKITDGEINKINERSLLAVI